MKKNSQKPPNSEETSMGDGQMMHEEEIRKRAYELWEEGGSQHGRHMEHWLNAEKEVQARQAQKS
jgi:hypothetical protein